MTKAIPRKESLAAEGWNPMILPVKARLSDRGFAIVTFRTGIVVAPR
ncbi:hypothetical protein [Pseudaminobacter sp. NGMCC 1.201702]